MRHRAESIHTPATSCSLLHVSLYVNTQPAFVEGNPFMLCYLHMKTGKCHAGPVHFPPEGVLGGTDMCLLSSA